jgi:copper(I)-binding protein
MSLTEEEPVTASRTSRRRRLVAVSALGAGAVTAVALAACSTGQITQTDNQVPAVAGANASASPNSLIGLRNAVVAYDGPEGYPSGGSAPLVVRIFNDGPRAVRLVAVDAGDAGSVVLANGTDEGFAPAATPTGSPTPGVETATPPPSAPAGESTFSVEVPPSSYALLVPGDGPHLRLVGLREPLTPGASVPLTFRFDDGSTIAVTVPMDLPAQPAPRGSPVDEAAHEEE